MLSDAVDSVNRQTLERSMIEICVAVDGRHQGVVDTRNRAWRMGTAPWVAFLDDDDELLPDHLELLLDAALREDADLVFSNWRVPEAQGFKLDSFCYGEWDPENPRQTTITFLVKRSLLEELGGFQEPEPDKQVGRDHCGEDHDFILRANARGARIYHLQELTWLWHHHGSNTSGRSNRW